MVARRPKRAVDAAKDALAAMADLGQLAMHRQGRTHDVAAEGLADRLMAETDAQDRNAAGGLFYQVEADAGLVRGAGAGRQHDRLGLRGEHRVGGRLVVAPDSDLRPQSAQIMDEVEGEAVIVVDQDDHAFTCWFKVLDRGAPGGQGDAPRCACAGRGHGYRCWLAPFYMVRSARPTHRHCPRKRAIQDTRQASGLLDRPLSRTMTAGGAEGGCR